MPFLEECKKLAEKATGEKFDNEEIREYIEMISEEIKAEQEIHKYIGNKIKPLYTRDHIKSHVVDFAKKVVKLWK